jgi:AcrR family transcriptional regulator
MARPTTERPVQGLRRTLLPSTGDRGEPQAVSLKTQGASPKARPLDETWIVDVAMELLREEGVATFSMRHLTTRLGVAVGATYRHVPGKQELLTLCLARIYAEVDRPRGEDEDPRAWVRDLIVRLFEVMAQSPGMAAWSAQNGRLDSSNLTPAVIEALETSGVGPEEAGRMMHVLFFFVAGALSVDYKAVMERVGVQDYAENLRQDIDHILSPRRTEAVAVPVRRRRRAG